MVINNCKRYLKSDIPKLLICFPSVDSYNIRECIYSHVIKSNNNTNLIQTLKLMNFIPVTSLPPPTTLYVFPLSIQCIEICHVWWSV